ncbi:hypothetical protein HDU96_000534 [Phlyctochytrium bullatum]|nr:hypothetical protein HDU96_000534 [Phlyctochytrium bullatum]
MPRSEARSKERVVKVAYIGSTIGGLNDSLKEISIGPLKLRIFESDFSNAGFGYQTWGSSYVLGSLILNGKIDLRGKEEEALELGCGTGLGGIIAAKCGARVRLTDFMDSLLATARKNADVNGVLDKTCFEILDWRFPEEEKGTFPVIFGADLIYEIEHAALVANVCSIYLANCRDARIHFVLPIRPKFEKEIEELEHQMLLKGFIQADELLFERNSADDSLMYAFATGEHGFKYLQYMRREEAGKTTGAAHAYA